MRSFSHFKFSAVALMLLALSACGGTTTDTAFTSTSQDDSTTDYVSIQDDTTSTSDTPSDTPTSDTPSDTPISDTPSDTPSKTGVVTLNWLPPTENSDGSTLVDLNGYNIYYGLTPDMLGNSISLDNPGLTSFVVENLDTNTTYYFAITAKNSQNAESELSNIVSKVTNS